jgi:hypothetical protein
MESAQVLSDQIWQSLILHEVQSMKTKIFGLAVAVLAFSCVYAVEAQQGSKISRIGCLFPGVPFYGAPLTDAFRHDGREFALAAALCRIRQII